MTKNNSHFQPSQSDLQGKPNSRVLVRIERDGTSLSLRRLHVVNDRDREEIICLHFLRKYLPLEYQRNCGINILSRDSPWDFELEIECGENFNIEVTSISDNEKLFELESAHRELTFAISNERLQPRKKQKLNKTFPHTLISRNEGGKSVKAENPYFGKQVITVSPLPQPTKSYGSLISAALSAKANKTHKDKDNTILIIDDQTTAFTSNEILTDLNSLELLSPFKEVWIYVGYWGTTSGDGEYTLIKFLPDA